MRPRLLSLVFALALAGPLHGDPAERLPRDLLLYLELTAPARLPDRVCDLPAWRDKKLAHAEWRLISNSLTTWANKHLRLDSKLLLSTLASTTKLTVALGEREARGNALPLLLLADVPQTTQLSAELAVHVEQGSWFKLAAEGKILYRTEAGSDLTLFVHLSPTQVACATKLATLVDYVVRSKPREDNLAALAQFRQARKRYGAQPVWAFASIARLMAQVTAKLTRQSRRAYDLIDAEFGLERDGYAAAGGHEMSLMLGDNSPASSFLVGGPLDHTLLSFLPPASGRYAYGTLLEQPIKRWKRLRRLATQLESKAGNSDLLGWIADLPATFGFSAAELFATLGPSVVITTPEIRRRIRPEALTIITRIRDRRAFHRLRKKALAGAWVKKMAPRRRQLTYRGAKIVHADQPGGPGYAQLGENLILTGDHRCLRAFIDAKRNKQSLAQRYRLTGYSQSKHWIVVDPAQVARTLFGYRFLSELSPEETAWQLSATTDGGTLRIRSNIRLSTVAGALLLTHHRHQRVQTLAMRCEANLEHIGQALRKHYEKNQSLPATLAELKLKPETTACPHGKRAYPYHPLDIKPRGPLWSGPMVAWCPNTIHGWIILNAGGYAHRTSQRNFDRYQAELKKALGQTD